jgi:similar to stage IV sporulation protein
MVREGDVVQAGDLLVTGLIEVSDGTTVSYDYLHATAEVMAKTVYGFSVDVPLVYGDREYTGNVKRDYIFVFFDRELNLTRRNVGFENYVRHTEFDILRFGENYPLPFRRVTVEYREFVPVTRERDEGTALAIGVELITEIISKELDLFVNILERNDSFYNDGEYLRVTTEITVLHRIDVKRPAEEFGLTEDGVNGEQ